MLSVASAAMLLWVFYAPEKDDEIMPTSKNYSCAEPHLT